FQNVRSFPGLTALQNVAMAVPHQPGESLLRLFAMPFGSIRADRRTRAKAMQHLEFVGAADLADELVGNLAFGQQKLVAFARMLATDADVLLLDEPTSGVDPKSAEQIIELVRSLAAMGKTICIVEHSLHVVTSLSDRVVFMDAGKVIAEGSVDNITKREDLVDLYFGT
ncbi:MAG: ATP-binding cassette domain-containing protein, partial [Dehalococcoidia bacterium]|nr:ATP-binding cassette domain-containing protein [Dehalococcoidia bacterium]